MEEYVIEKEERENYAVPINQGCYYKKVHSKHIESYGDFGANNIRDNIMSTFKVALEQYYSEKNNNMLLVGKVQSGKTSNLELFTALALDNGYNMVIIYGGYDNTLLSQTTNRFKKTFDIPSEMDYADELPVVFSSDDSAKLLTVDDEIIEDLLDSNKPIFIISMKRPAAMNKVNDLLNRIEKKQLKAFIIDDEGDQASLNTKKNKKEDASATYASICKMKDLLNEPLYLSVTATPQALVFLDEYSRLRPDSIRVIEPGKGYCGADAYHLFDNDIIEIIDPEDQQLLSEGKFAESLRKAIKHYIIASAIMKKRGCQTSEMIIHSHRNVTDHDTIYRMVSSYIQELKDHFEFDDEENINIVKKEYLDIYKSLFKSEIVNTYEFNDLWEIIENKIVKRIYIILKNSAGQVTQATESFRKHKIYIGGDLLQRGVTFPKLVTTYFSRWAKDSGNMDTNLQRARWFGYREKYIDVCKIFTSSEIAREFTNLSEIETDLWEQFNAIEEGNMQIEEILLKADNTKQKPTRKNVATYSTVTFKNRWIKQRVGIFDKKQIEKNNLLVEKLLKECNMTDTNVGRRDRQKSASYTIIEKTKLQSLIEHMQAIFDLEPFEKKPLQDLIESDVEIPVILMNNQGIIVRKRSFYNDNKIYALQQGADNSDPNKVVYEGDSHVIIDKNCVNIQIHKILPMKKDNVGNKKELEDCVQYMFAIYVPKEKKYYVKG
ncbi:MAG: Z1 domain-containing protein [Eubacterium sp.]|nr:Z1 domain-containing protein [Eubacterium sp.]